MLYLRNCPCSPSMFGKIATLRYLSCLSYIWRSCIPHMSGGHSKTLPNPLPLLSFSYSSLSYNNWSKLVLRMCTWYTINSTTSNHHSNRSGHAWLSAIFILRWGSTFRIPFPVLFQFLPFVLALSNPSGQFLNGGSFGLFQSSRKE